VRIPADVEREDRLLGNLTARQLAILAVAGVVLWAGYSATRQVVAPVFFGVVAVPFGALSILLALGSFEGVAADRWVRAAWRHHRAPHRLVPAPDGIAPPPVFAGAAGSLPSPLRLPLVGIKADGSVDLGTDGHALVCRARAVTFSLRTFAEQEALVSGFARFLNSLAEPVEILVRAEPADLVPIIDGLLRAAPELPHPALEAAARGHARFLTELAAHQDLLRREVLIVLRQGGDDASGRLHRRAAEAAAALGAAGVSLVVLDGPAAASCLSRALDSDRETPLHDMGGTEQPITIGRVTSEAVG
jgi:hypothetical protein